VSAHEKYKAGIDKVTVKPFPRAAVDESSLPQMRLAPDEPDQAAFVGLAGDIVEAIMPHTEAAPVALLAQLLVGFGNMVGRAPHFSVGATWHRVNEFMLLVGPTGTGRKGSSWDYVRRLTEIADPVWEQNRTVSGLSSGEGLINAVRDAREDPNAKNPDPGVTDKRVLAIQTEFAETLKVMSREGNTLSAVIRAAWDGGKLRVLTKNDGLIATGAHVSIIGHITPEELRKQLDKTEVANGLLNRFLLVYTRMSKFLPEGGALEERTTLDFGNRVAQSLACSAHIHEMRRHPDATELWREVYPSLVTPRPGLIGSVTSRAAPHVLRLSCLYALLEGRDIVSLVDLKAALAFWRYSEATALFVFGEALGDPIQDRILNVLKQQADGCTRTELLKLFSNNMSAQQIATALGLLYANGLVSVRKVPTGGRSKEVWAYKPNHDPSFPSFNTSSTPNGKRSPTSVHTLSQVVEVINEVNEREGEAESTDEELSAFERLEERRGIREN
jgi:hypothetical protein